MVIRGNTGCQFFWQSAKLKKQEAQGLGALLDKMEDNDHINTEI